MTFRPIGELRAAVLKASKALKALKALGLLHLWKQKEQLDTQEAQSGSIQHLM